MGKKLDLFYVSNWWLVLPCDVIVISLQSIILQVNVSISSRDSYCIDVVLRCLAIAGDGLEPHDLNDGGILGTIMAAGFKGSNIIKLVTSIREL